MTWAAAVGEEVRSKWVVPRPNSGRVAEGGSQRSLATNTAARRHGIELPGARQNSSTRVRRQRGHKAWRQRLPPRRRRRRTRESSPSRLAGRTTRERAQARPMGLEQQQRKAARRRAAKVCWARRREQHALESAGVIKYAARAVPRQAEAKRKPRSNASRRIENTARRNRQLVSLRLEQQHDKRSSGGAARLPVRASSRDGDKSQCSNMCSRPNLPCLCCKNIGQEISPSRLRGRTGDNNFIIAEATRDESSDGGTARRCRARAVYNTARARCGGVGMINNKR